MDSSLGNNNSVGGGGGKRKIEDAVELAKQKAQAIAARLLNDADSKRPRTDSSPPSQQPDFPVPYTTNQTPHYNYNGGAAAAAAGLPTSKKIQIPNAKVGVIIGRGGDMIKTLQLESGARIQITRDADADPSSFTRDVELMGTPDQIARAEQRIHEVIAETDATSSASSALRGASTPQPPTAAAGADQFVMKVPNDKVALVIGKGGETIKMMQGRSGARIQVVPLHLPPGDTSTERNIFINGTKDQIDSAKELVNEVISGNRLKVMSGTNMYQQPGYPPSAGWAPQGQPSAQQPPAYGYTQPGAYAMPPPPYYSGYPPQPAAWDQSAATPQQQSTAYSAYGQAQPPSSTPPNVNYNYSQVPPAAGYNYNQGYPQQQPSYGQDTSDQTKAYANPAYAPSATSTQPDGSNSVQTPQPSYGAPAAIPGQPDGTAQTQPPSAYAAAYSQPPAAPANGYNAYPSYSGAAPVQPVYNQTGYPLTGYGQQQDAQIASQASYAYYGQSGYPPSQAPAQSGYYHSGYPPAVPPPHMPPQTQTQATNGVSQTSSYGVERTDGGDATTGSASAAEESEKTQS